LGAAALAQQSEALEASFAVEEAQIAQMQANLSIVTASLVASAAILSAVLAILTSLAFTKLRSQLDDPLAHWTRDDGAESYVTDSDGEEESIVGNQCEYDLDFGQNMDEDANELPTGEGRTVEIGGMEDSSSDIEVDRTEALFNDEDDDGYSSRPSQPGQRSSRCAVSSRRHGGTRNRSPLRAANRDSISSS